jgi:hypothetical protein
MDPTARHPTRPHRELFRLQRFLLPSLEINSHLTPIIADPGYHMHLQAELGDVDFITGDYLAEVNIAENAQAHAAGNHPGWEQTAWDGIEQTIDLLNERRIKVVINGGAHKPRGLAEKVYELVSYLRVGCFQGFSLL